MLSLLFSEAYANGTSVTRSGFEHFRSTISDKLLALLYSFGDFNSNLWPVECTKNEL
jgi:hypothetical protein